MNRICRLLALALLEGLLLTACNQDPEKTESSDSTLGKSQVAEDLSDDFQQIARRILPAVVSISTRGSKLVSEEMPDDETHQDLPGQKQEGLGSGVIVDATKGYILTNNHVVSGAEQIEVTLQNGRRANARVVGTDPPSDLAVLQLQNPPSLKAAVLGDSSVLRVGEWVLAIGSPFGLDSTVTAGIISAKGRAEMGVADFEDFIQTDAAINPGNSGGPLVNIKGELIGINTAIATRSTGYMGIGFAIPSNMAKLVMQELIEKGKVTRSQLGVYIGEVDQDLRQALKLGAQQQGILVMQVIPGTPAAEVGFKKYDLITSLNGQPVTQVQPFRNQIALTMPGQRLQISLVRNGKILVLRPLLREMQAEPLSVPATLEKRLGFRLDPLPEALRRQLGLPESFSGLAVTSVRPDSNAYRRGLRQGDLVIEINRQRVGSAEEVQQAIAAIKPGEAVLMNIIRDGQSRILAFELEE
ncbi:MAG: Do family serine endopeptidase [Candidatus Sericytochromatia bacterium]